MSDPDLKRYAGTLPSIQISDRSACDLELLVTGAFAPLDRFMGAAAHQRVLDEMRLADGAVFPIPITLPVDDSAKIDLHHDLALRNSRNDLLAVMTVEEIYGWDHDEVAAKVFRTNDPRHPLIAEMKSWGKLNIS